MADGTLNFNAKLLRRKQLRALLLAVTVFLLLVDSLLSESAVGSKAQPSLYLKPRSQTVMSGARFLIEVWVSTENATVDTVDAYIEFDPNLLVAVDEKGKPTEVLELNTTIFPFATYNDVDNTLGQANLSASVFSSPYLSGTFRVASLWFTAKLPTSMTDIEVIRKGARWSDLFLGGVSLNPTLRGSTIRVYAVTGTATPTPEWFPPQPPQPALYLPLLVKGDG